MKNLYYRIVYLFDFGTNFIYVYIKRYYINKVSYEKENCYNFISIVGY